ncbi:MAG: hypothetical protein JXB62_22210 [Pirellulales bacterium]|nr:hypothetical protein [Pirellulales bacterium]
MFALCMIQADRREASRRYLEAICRRLVENLVAHRRQKPEMPTLNVLNP